MENMSRFRRDLKSMMLLVSQRDCKPRSPNHLGEDVVVEVVDGEQRPDVQITIDAHAERVR